MARPLVPRGGPGGPELRHPKGRKSAFRGSTPSSKKRKIGTDGFASGDDFSRSTGAEPKQIHVSPESRTDTLPYSPGGKKKRRIVNNLSRRPGAHLATSASPLPPGNQRGRGGSPTNSDVDDEEGNTIDEGCEVQGDLRTLESECQSVALGEQGENEEGSDETEAEEEESDDDDDDDSCLFSPFPFSVMEGVLHTRLVRTLQHHGFKRPTEIQELAIPTVLHGHDTLIQSYTGSGKTLCFALPLLQQLLQQHERSGKQLDRRDGTRCLLLLPTRELAAQAWTQISRLAQLFPWIVVAAITGGEKKQSEKRRLRAGVTVLLCTPGRLLDHLTTTSAFQVPYLHLVVLDEADRLLDMGFEAKIRKIMTLLSEKKEEQLQMREMRRELLSETREEERENAEDEDETDGALEGSRDDEGKGGADTVQHFHERSQLLQANGKRKKHNKGLLKDKQLAVSSMCGSQLSSDSTDWLCIRKPEDGFQVIMASATLTTQVQRLAAFCLRHEPQWVSLERYRPALRGRRAELEDEQDNTKAKGVRATMIDTKNPDVSESSSTSDSSSVTFPCCCMLTPEPSSREAVDTDLVGASTPWDPDVEANDEMDADVCSGTTENARQGKKEVFHVPEQLRQYFVKVQSRTRLLPLLSLLLEVAKKGKGKAVVFLSCCDAVEYLHSLCTRLKWPGMILDRAQKQRQIEQLKVLRSMKEKHVARLQKAVKDMEKQKRKIRKQSKAYDEDERPRGLDSRCDNDAVDDGTDSSDGDEDATDEEEDVGDELLGDFIFNGVKMYKLHGQMNRDDRIGYLKDFSDAPGSAVLFATDVAARGLNLPYVNWIAQFDLPQQAEEYVHRIGRTARLGKEGNAVLFVLDCEAGYVNYLQSRGITLNEMDESCMLATLFKTHMPEYLRRIDNASAFLIKQFSQFVSARHSLLQTARKAFLGTLRSFRALSKETRQICTHAALHTGHMASSFCLNEAPRLAAFNLRRGAPSTGIDGPSTAGSNDSRERPHHSPAGHTRSVERPSRPARGVTAQKKGSQLLKHNVSGAPGKTRKPKLKVTRGFTRIGKTNDDDGIIESVQPCFGSPKRHEADHNHASGTANGESAAFLKGTPEAIAFAAKRLREKGEVLSSKAGGRQKNKTSTSASRLPAKIPRQKESRNFFTDSRTQRAGSSIAVLSKRKGKAEPRKTREQHSSRKQDIRKKHSDQGAARVQGGSRMRRLANSEFAC
ncbi:dead deah box helicase domain-containing protein [Cystoisospora suis]|uniref:ATP-dependent RNA helicase n=1 Tax=Cystoisospora suis TaxID=483139 RepID=A0A2C6L5J2_9APIC|nr:dead deah box helicase domain-containing protein [Cystoisospora suis]